MKTIEHLKRFQEVVCFLTALAIRKNFATLAEYKDSKSSSKAYHLHIDGTILRKLSRIGTRHCFNELVTKSKHLFWYNKHCHKHSATSGKSFSRNSWFALCSEELERWFADEANFNASTCTLIGDEAREFLNTRVFVSHKDKNDMTKSDEERIRRECAEGKHGCSAEYLIKEQRKAERRAEKTAQRRFDKSNEALQKLIVENAQLKQRVEELEAELKQYAEAEVPEDEACAMDEQDKALIAACEAEADTTVATPEQMADEALETMGDYTIDESQTLATAKMIAELGRSERKLEKKPEPKPEKKPTAAEAARAKSNEDAHLRNVNAKQKLQKLIDDEVVDVDDAKLLGRVMCGWDFKLREGHRGWGQIMAEKSLGQRFKIFDALVERMKRGEYFSAAKADRERVKARRDSMQRQLHLADAKRRQEAYQERIMRAAAKHIQEQTPPPPIAVVKPQPPVVTEENAGAVLEDLGL